MMVATTVTKDFVLDRCEIYYKKLTGLDFDRVSGKAQLLRDIADLVTFITLHQVEPKLLGKMDDELVKKFNELVERTQVNEKEDTGP